MSGIIISIRVEQIFSVTMFVQITKIDLAKVKLDHNYQNKVDKYTIDRYVVGN